MLKRKQKELASELYEDYEFQTIWILEGSLITNPMLSAVILAVPAQSAF